MDHKTSLGQEQKQRKVVVYPTQRSMSVSKTDSPRFIPHEPVRGAVSSSDKKSLLRSDRVSEAATKWSVEHHELRPLPKASAANTKRSLEQHEIRGNEASAATTKWNMEHHEMLPTVNERATVALTNRLNRVQPLSSSEQVSNSSVVYPQPVLQYHDKHQVPFQGSSMLSSSNSPPVPSALQLPLREDHTAILSARLMHGSSSLEEVTDNGGRDNGGSRLKEESQLLDSSSEVIQLKEELEVLMKVNSDLKKLLVASIGDDLQYKVDALVRTKVQLANEIGDYTRKLVEDYEDLDKLSIQADLWHSKYQASRVLVEQLTLECDRLNGSLGQAEMALQYNIQERHELQELLLLSRRNLLALVGSQRQSSVERFRTKRPHTLDLAIDIKRLTDTACRSLAGGIPPSEPEEDVRSSFTPAELLTHQVLSSVKSGGSVCATGQRGSTFVARHLPILLPRFHPGARYEGFTFSCCAHCKGEVFVL